MSQADSCHSISLSRRQSLLAGVGIFGAAILPAACVPEDARASVDPFNSLFAVHKADRSALDAINSDRDPDGWDRQEAVCHASWQSLIETPPKSTAGLLAFLEWLEVDDNSTVYVDSEINILFDMIARSVRSITS